MYNILLVPGEKPGPPAIRDREHRRYVQNDLLDRQEPDPRLYPFNLRHGMNRSARGCLVAPAPVPANDIGNMVKQGEVDSIDDHHCDDRGLTVHKPCDYPVNPVVDGVIADRWGAA
jgi:hypothetical protein